MALKIQPRPDWAYFLDFDGTLVDMAETPEAIRVGHGLVELLRTLHARTGGATALVSGRAIADLDRHLGLGHLPIGGQHGFEHRNAAGRLYRHPVTPAPAADIARRLAPLIARHPGLKVEDKGSAVAIHYRLAPRLAGYLHRLTRQILAADPGLEVQPGKLVLEIKPKGHDKGSVIAQFMAQPPFRGRVPVFIGDDLGDEPAFAAVNRLGGLSIKVGAGPTAARHRLPDVAAVRDWLGRVLRATASADRARSSRSDRA